MRTKTVVDTQVRNTLEVDAGSVEYSAEFAAAIESAGRELATYLNLEADRTQVELYKLPLYPKGGFFLPHRDSEKRNGMVATMIVVLPSRFGGGELIIQHDERRETFSFDQARNQTQSQYAAFFADYEHSIAKSLRFPNRLIVSCTSAKFLAIFASSQPMVTLGMVDAGTKLGLATTTIWKLVKHTKMKS